LLDEHLPSTGVWINGSGAKWISAPKSVLDLVVFTTPEQQQEINDLRKTFEESNLPFRVDLSIWEEMSENFHEDYIVLANRVSAQVTTNWRETSIGEIADIVGGGTPSTKDRGNFNGCIPWLTPKDLSGTHERYIRRGERNLSQKGLNNSSARLLPAHSVLLSTRAPIGYVALAKNPIATNQGFRSLIVRDGVIPEFLYYWIKLNTQELERHASGSTFRELSGSALKDIRIKVPSLPEQRTITHILSTLDDKIELNRRMNETLEAMTRALFKSWFVDFDPVRAKMEGRDTGLPKHIADLFPGRLVESELGKIPEGWRVGSVNDICKKIENGGTPKRSVQEYWNGNIQWFKTSELVDEPLLNSSEQITQKGLDYSSCKRWPKGTVLIALYAAPTVGRLGILEISATANQACCGLNAESNFGNQFLYYVLLFRRSYFHRIAVGAAQQNISQKIVRDCRIIIPCTVISRTFHSWAEAIYSQRVTELSESRTLSDLRNTLLPKLILGEIRLPKAGTEMEAQT